MLMTAQVIITIVKFQKKLVGTMVETKEVTFNSNICGVILIYFLKIVNQLGLIEFHLTPF